MEEHEYPHKLAGVYPDQEKARAARDELLDTGLPRKQLRLIAAGDPNTDEKIDPESTATRDEMVKDTSVGAGAGTVAGAASAAGAEFLLPSLFISAPVVGGLIALGYGAALGGVAGAIYGMRMQEGMFASIVKDAVDDGNHVLVVHAHSEEEKEKAEKVMEHTMVASETDTSL